MASNEKAPTVTITSVAFRGTVLLEGGNYTDVVTEEGQKTFDGAVVTSIKEERMGLEIEMASGAKRRVPYAQIQSYSVA